MNARGLMAATVVAAAACGGCGGRASIDVPFDAKAAEFINKSGTGRIEGEAFLRRDYGRLVTAAGEHVFLVPATPYTTARFDRMFGGDKRSYFGTSIDDTPDDYYNYRRDTKVDARGRFVFDKLYPGRYIVATRVFWTEPSRYVSLGGAIYDVVEVKNDETTIAVISGK